MRVGNEARRITTREAETVRTRRMVQMASFWCQGKLPGKQLHLLGPAGWLLTSDAGRAESNGPGEHESIRSPERRAAKHLWADCPMLEMKATVVIIKSTRVLNRVRKFVGEGLLDLEDDWPFRISFTRGFAEKEIKN